MRLVKTTVTLLFVLIVLTVSVLPLSASEDPVLTYREDFNWGVCMHTPGGVPTYGAANIEEQLYLAAQMGCKLIRVDAGMPLYLDKFVKLCNAYGMKVMLIVYIPDRTFSDNYNLETVEQWYKTYATRYDGRHGCGKADYIQIDNEMDLPLLASAHPNGNVPDGSVKTHYKESELKNLTEQVKAAVRGIKASGSDVKTIINFSWLHYGMLEYFYNNGVEWDIVGHDWYSNMFQLSTRNDAYWSGETVYQKFKKPIIICETNMFGKTADFDENDPSNWDDLVVAMKSYYSKDYVIGATLYELSDEVEKKGTSYNQEANFGFLYTNDDGSIKGKKPVFDRIRNIFGGGEVKRVDWSLLEGKNDTPPSFDGQPNDEQTADDYTSPNNNSSGTVTVIKPDPIIIIPDPITKEITQVETVIRKVPVPSGEIFTTPVIISVAVGGSALLVVIGSVVYVLVKRKRRVK